jgi:excisionase family DNA binding protein
MMERQAGPQHLGERDGERGTTMLTVRAVAQLLGMSPRWVHERVRRGEIPHYKFGRSLRFDLEEVRRWRVQYQGASMTHGERRPR